MTTNAPQIPVKTITALWFSMFAPCVLPSLNQEEKRKLSPARQRSGHSQTALFLSHDNPQRKIMMMAACTQADPDARTV